MAEILADLKEGHYSSSNWKDLGLQLGLHYTTLKAIKSDSSEVEDRLMECLAKWLEKADGVDDKGGATWSTLARALEQSNSGKSTAEHISKYIYMYYICSTCIVHYMCMYCTYTHDALYMYL